MQEPMNHTAEKQLSSISDKVLDDGQQPPGELSAFLTIPQELRDEIHKHLLQYPTSVPLERHDGLQVRARGAKRSYLSLSLTCRQLRKEALDIFFGNNDIEVGYWAGIANVPDVHISKIKHIRVQDWIGTISESPVSCALHLRQLGTQTHIDVVGDYTSRLSGDELELQSESQQGLHKMVPVFEAAKPAARMLQHSVRTREGVEGDALRAVAKKLWQGWAVL